MPHIRFKISAYLFDTTSIYNRSNTSIQLIFKKLYDFKIKIEYMH